MKRKDSWLQQGQALRHPEEIICARPDESGLNTDSLVFRATSGFLEVLDRLQITLLLTREYEHLLLALSVEKGRLRQSYVHLPHPSGLAVDHLKQRLYVASTRNPNQIWEFSLSKRDTYLRPNRVKFYPGRYYFHELTFINNVLYANSVGQNAIIPVDINSALTEKPVWWPNCIEDRQQKPDFSRNYLQLNSIAAGKSLDTSYFSASTDHIGKSRPGQRYFPVDKQGVIFSGQTRTVFAHGLTRPHSARIYQNRVWVDNSGYGEVGYIDEYRFFPVTKLPGWTRGLLFKDEVMFVGVSRVLPRFAVYAPGLTGRKQECSLYALETKSGRILGKISFPFGNQIFSFDWIDKAQTPGFIATRFTEKKGRIRDKFYQY